ncbi:MAG: amidohydrolase family protein, partial [Chloroflexi bacterium]|nr:amidohydrolase family protein [Chloroflexota bacterium]
AIGPGLAAGDRTIDLAGRVVAPGFVETHVHLDKAGILERCVSERGTLEEAIGLAAAAKKGFTTEDVHTRAAATLERLISHGTMHVRTHLEVDPSVGLRSLEGVMPLVEEYRWAVDLHVCVFPQDGLLNNPGTDELMVAALRRGCRAVGAAPYTDSDPHGQIDRVFAMAREFDVDVDMHLDFGASPERLDIEYVCEQTTKHGWGGRVTVGHITKLSFLEPDALNRIARRLADSGVAVTVLPSTDLYLMGREHTRGVPRGVTPIHRMLPAGVRCSLSSNNILNPFTPFGDGSQLRMANLYANICQAGSPEDVAACFSMVTSEPAAMLRLRGYGVAVGNAADLTVLDARTTVDAVRQLAPVLYAFKRGRQTVTRAAVQLHHP